MEAKSELVPEVCSQLSPADMIYLLCIENLTCGAPQVGQQAALTPRTKRWLNSLAIILPRDQRSKIVDVFMAHTYNSMDTIMKEDLETLLNLPEFEGLKAGAVIAVQKRIRELKVRYSFIQQYMCNVIDFLMHVRMSRYRR